MITKRVKKHLKSYKILTVMFPDISALIGAKIVEPRQSEEKHYNIISTTERENPYVATIHYITSKISIFAGACNNDQATMNQITQTLLRELSKCQRRFVCIDEKRHSYRKVLLEVIASRGCSTSY